MSLTKARELAVLSIINAHPVHGYQLASAFEEGPMQLLGLKKSAVYGMLARFVKRGWVEEKSESGGSYPDRRICYITQAGRVAVTELIAASQGLSQIPLMSLMLLHDSGIDVRDTALVQLDERENIVAGLVESDDAHTQTMTNKLALALLNSEIEILKLLLLQSAY